jgi:uncharacterized cupredoxin-like copper-binding protein
MAMVNSAASWFRFIAVSLSALVMGACAYGDAPLSDAVRSEESETVNVVLKEWYVLPDKRTVNESTVTFKVVNRGRMDHEFIIIKTDLPLHALPVHEKGLNEKKAGRMMGEIEDLRPGEAGEMTIYMPPGNYVLFCNKVETVDHKTISHYRRGMRVAFKVRSDKD